MKGRRSALTVGVAVAATVIAAGASLTLPLEQANSQAVARDAPAAPPTQPLVVPPPEAPPPPTRADFARGAGSPTTTAGSDKRAIEELRKRADAKEIPAMEELARRLLQGDGVAKDQQAGAGWLLRAAEHGSAQAAFNVGVMYERGFVVERDSTRAVEWYRKAAEADLPMAKHNLALLLRDGKGAPRDGKKAVELLRSATHQGMAASMFALGDIYERGDGAEKDQAAALAWFAITAEFERQTNRDGETQLAKTALQRVEALKRVMLPRELERAQQIGQSEFKQIVAALQPPKLPAPALPEATVPAPADTDPPGWPKAATDQVRAIQQALLDLKFLRDKPDGVVGPVTRAAIRAFQKSIGTRETGEPTKALFAALQEALARAAAPPAIDLGRPEPPPPPPTSADITRTPPN